MMGWLKEGKDGTITMGQIQFVIILPIWYNEFIGILTAIRILQRVIILINNLVQYVNFYFNFDKIRGHIKIWRCFYANRNS